MKKNLLLCVLVAFFASIGLNDAIAQSKQSKTVVLTSGSNQTWTAPVGACEITKIEAWGGGGGGGQASSNLIARAGSGGGGGGYCAYQFSTPQTVTPNVSTCSYSVAASVGQASDGNKSTVTFGSVSLTANGGKKGSTNTGKTSISGGQGGTATGGTTNTTGTQGGTSSSRSSAGAGGSGANGGNGGSAGSSSDGGDGLAPGGGGGGGHQGGLFGSHSGGNGAIGRVSITYNELTITVNLNLNGGSSNTTSFDVLYYDVLGNGKNGEKIDNITPSKDGYVFLGWYDANGNQVNNNTQVTSTSNVTYTARYLYTGTLSGSTSISSCGSWETAAITNASTEVGAITNYEWFCNDQSTNVSGANKNKLTSADYAISGNPGAYVFTCEVTANGKTGLTSGSYTINVTFDAGSVTSGSANKVPGTEVTINGSAVTGAEYQWYQNGSEISGETSQNLTINAPSTEGDYVYTRAAKANGCTMDFVSSANTYTVTVVAVNPGEIKNATAFTCQAGTFATESITAASIDPQATITYKWTKNGTDLANSNVTTLDETSIDLANLTAGQYTFKRYAKAGTGAWKEATGAVTLNVVALPASWTAPAAVYDNLCLGGVDTFPSGDWTLTNVSDPVAKMATHFQWQDSYDGGQWHPAGESDNLVIQFNNVGTYKVKVDLEYFNQANCVVSTGEKSVTIVADPSVNVPTLSNNNICPSEEITLTSFDPQGGYGATGTYTHYWDINVNGTGWQRISADEATYLDGTLEGQTYTGATLRAKDFTQTGDLQFRSYVSNQYGCDATSQEVALAVATIPAAIIAGDTIVCVKENEEICFRAQTTGSQYALAWFDENNNESATAPCVDRITEKVVTVEVAQKTPTCYSAKRSQTITVSYSADLDYVDASADTTKTLCEEETIETNAGGIQFSYSGDCEPTCNFEPNVPAGVTVTNDANNKLLVIAGTPTEAGVYTYKVFLDPQMGECVSPNVFTGTLTVNPVYDVMINASICPGGSYMIGDTWGNEYHFTTTGLHSETLRTVNGCDSTVSVDLYVEEWNQFGYEDNESLIAGWTNFSSVSSPISADAGVSRTSSNISYSGWNGSNERKDNLSSSTPLISASGSSLGLINGTFTASGLSGTLNMNNDKSIVLKTSTKGYSNIKLYLDYGIERVSSGNNDHGFSLFSFAYSTDGLTYTNCDSKSITLESGTRVDGNYVMDLSQKSSKAVDNQDYVYVRITFSGAAKSVFGILSAFTEYSLLDNIVFSGKKAIDELEISAQSTTVCTNQGISLATNAPYTNTDVTPAVTTPVNYKWERIVNGTSTVLESTDYYMTDVDNIPEGDYKYVVSVGEGNCAISDTLDVTGVAPAYRLDIVKHAHVCANEVDQIANYVFEDMSYADGMHIVTPTVDELRIPGVHNCELSVPTTSNPCDSVITLALTVNKAFDTTVVAYICLGETYDNFGFNITPTEEGVSYYTSPDTWKCSTGCDSVYRLTLITNSVMDVLSSESNVTLAAWNMDNGTNNFQATCGVRTENSKFAVINNSEFSNVSGHAPTSDYCYSSAASNGALQWANLACNCSGLSHDPVPTMFDGVYFEIQLNPKNYNNLKLKFDYKRDNASTSNAQAFNQVNYSYKFAAGDSYTSLGSQSISNTAWSVTQYDLSSLGDATLNKEVMYIKIEFTGGNTGSAESCGFLSGSKYLPSYITVDNLMIIADRPAMGQLNGNAQTCSATEICEGDDVTFTRDANAIGFDFFLVNDAIGLDSAFTTNNSISIKPTESGTYTIKAIDVMVGCDSTWNYDITVRKAPTITYVRGTNDDGVCGLGSLDIEMSVENAESYSFTWQTADQQAPAGINVSDDQNGTIAMTGRFENDGSARYIVLANPYAVCGNSPETKHGTIANRHMPKLYRIEDGNEFYPVLDTVCQDYAMQFYVDTVGLIFGENTLDQAIIWKNINGTVIGTGDTLEYNADEAKHSMKQYVTVMQTGCTTMDTFDLVVYNFAGDTISAPDAEYELNYNEYSMPASYLVVPTVIHNGQSMPQSYIDEVQWNQTSNDWNNLTPEQINPSVITTPAQDNLTTYVWWRIKDKCGNWHYTNNGVPQKVTLALPPCGDYTGLSGERLVAIDADGNEYESVSVGWECWTKTNIKAIHYSVDQQYFVQGDSIEGAMIYSAEMNSDTTANLNKYGRLYTWYSAVGLPEGADDATPIPLNEMGHVQGICPKGWYLPTAEAYQSILSINAEQLRTNLNWMVNPGSNTSGMSMEPGGMYNSGAQQFADIAAYAYFWTCEPTTINSSMVRSYMADCFCYMIREVLNSKTSALSVRCIKERELSAPKFKTLTVMDQSTMATATAKFYAGGTAITNYEFMIADNQQMNNAQSFNTNSPVYTFTNLLPGYTYYVKVTATNEVGSATSTVVSVELH